MAVVVDVDAVVVATDAKGASRYVVAVIQAAASTTKVAACLHADPAAGVNGAEAAASRANGRRTHVYGVAAISVTASANAAQDAAATAVEIGLRRLADDGQVAVSGRGDRPG